MTDDDYELSPTTVDLLARYREGSDTIQRGADSDAQTREFVALIGGLDDREKGQTIIDLLTLVDAMHCSLTAMRLPPLD